MRIDSPLQRGSRTSAAAALRSKRGLVLRHGAPPPIGAPLIHAPPISAPVALSQGEGDEAAASPALSRWPFGVERLDAALGGGLARGHVHEIYATDGDDAAAAAGFAMAVLTGLSAGLRNAGLGGKDLGGTDLGVTEQGRVRSILWLRSAAAARRGGVLQAQGWADLGGRPQDTVFGVLPDELALLRAALDAVRSGTLAAVLIEHWGAMRAMDLTASRRFVLAAEATGTTPLFLHVAADAGASAAQTRWSIAAAPSSALPGKAPGAPVFDVELTRQRAGPSGLNWRLEWDREQGLFRDAALSGDTLPVPARAAGAGAGTGPDSVRWVA